MTEARAERAHVISEIVVESREGGKTDLPCEVPPNVGGDEHPVGKSKPSKTNPGQKSTINNFYHIQNVR
jgi:hypothetical protein